MSAAQQGPAQTDARQLLLAKLESIEPIVTLTHEKLVVIALASTSVSEKADYVTLADAQAGVQPAPFEFTELDAGGSVPTAQVTVGPKPLVVLAGETIVGGKQNRVINVTVWLGARKTTPIPVSCLEHGRWDAGRIFGAGLPVDLDFRSKVGRMDQSAVWREIDLKERLAARRSPTAALHELYATEEMDLDKVVAAFPMPEDASGLAIGIGGNLVALDLFDSPATLARQWPRLITSAALATLDYQRRVTAGMMPKPAHRYPDEGALGRMLDRAKTAAAVARVHPSVGEGEDVRLATTKLHGSALVHAGRVVHLALFRDEPPPKPPVPPRRDRADAPYRTPSPTPARPSERTFDQRARDLLDSLSPLPGGAPSRPFRPDEEQPVGVPVRGRPR